MKITKKSQLTDIERTLDIPVTEEQLKAWEDGMLIQRAMPNLTDSQREFIMTGITNEEWNEAFKEPEEKEEFDDREPDEKTGED